MTSYTKPLPNPAHESKPFWEGCRRHEFLLPRCRLCSFHWFPPSILCPECLSTEWDWVKATGLGTLHTFARYHRMYHPAFKEELPYLVAVIQLQEGPRILSNLVDCKDEDAYCDMPVEIVFEDATDEITLFKFKPRYVQ